MKVQIEYRMNAAVPSSVLRHCPFSKLPDYWETIEREIYPEMLFQTLAQDIFEDKKLLEECRSRFHYIKPEGLFTKFPRLAKELGIPRVPDVVPDELSPYVGEPLLKLGVQFGFFAKGGSDEDLWAVMVQNNQTEPVPPVIGHRLENGEWQIFTNQQRGGLKLEETGYIYLVADGKNHIFPPNHPCYPWIFTQPHYAYALMVLEDALAGSDTNPLTGILTNRDGAVRVCGNQVKEVIQKAVDALTLKKQFPK